MRRKKNKNLIKEHCYRGEEIGRKKRREVDREKSVGSEEAKGGDSESVRREKKTKGGEEVREFIVKNELCIVWERDCFPFFFGKQPIENKSYFYMIFY